MVRFLHLVAVEVPWQIDTCVSFGVRMSDMRTHDDMIRYEYPVFITPDVPNGSSNNTLRLSHFKIPASWPLWMLR